MSKVRKYDRNELTRKDRKLRYIKVRNLMRKYPECAYNGDFYCDHVWDPERPWTWVDFRFFHTTQKRYYAVAMITAETEALNLAEGRVWDQSSVLFPSEPWPDTNNMTDAKFNDWIRRPPSAQDILRKEFEEQALNELLDEPSFIAPSITLKDYGPVAIGCWVTVNKPFIDEHVIREFIAHFRSLGEPTTPGWSWKGKEEQVETRHFKRSPTP